MLIVRGHRHGFDPRIARNLVVAQYDQLRDVGGSQ